MTDGFVLRLDSASLLSKYGFNDGDEPDDIADALERDGFDYLKIPWKTALCSLVRAHLVPVLDQTVEVIDIETSHNPIRAVLVDGVEVDWSARPQPIVLTPSFVEIPYAIVLAAVRAADTPPTSHPE